MSNLDLWKNVKRLSVDEFMCLLFGLEPGAVKFDYGDSEEWPEKAEPIYRALAEDIQAGKLYVFIDTQLDPRLNDFLASHYFHTGEPWWYDGKLSKYALKEWLAKKNIQSDFFNTAPAATVVARQEASAESAEQAPVQGFATEEKLIKASGVNDTNSAPYHPETSVTAPRSTGSRRDIARIKATRQACEEVMKELNQEKQTFDNDNDNWNPKLLFATGKTTKQAFMNAVQERLDEKPHRDTVVAVWNLISCDLKHRGRVPEQ